VKVTKIIVDRSYPVAGGPWFETGSRWLNKQITFGWLITKLLEFELNVYWCMGSRLQCHTGRSGSRLKCHTRRYGPQRP